MHWWMHWFILGSKYDLTARVQRVVLIESRGGSARQHEGPDQVDISTAPNLELVLADPCGVCA
jgi:hypothetical protein